MSLNYPGKRPHMKKRNSVRICVEDRVQYLLDRFFVGAAVQDLPTRDLCKRSHSKVSVQDLHERSLSKICILLATSLYKISRRGLLARSLYKMSIR